MTMAPNTSLALPDLAGALVVSCQAPKSSPLRTPSMIAALAEAALLGGAAGIRVNGPDDVAAVRAITDRPIIGLHKVAGARRNIITPTLDLARGLVEAGATIVALDATTEALGEDFSLVTDVIDSLGCLVMADTSTVDEALRAIDHGAHLVGTTLSGYTPETLSSDDAPDLRLVEALSSRGMRVVAEGRYRTPAQVSAAFDAGAWCVVVGGAITDPLSTTQRFTAATPRLRE